MFIHTEDINKIIQETAYVRTGGTSEELRCAEYIAGKCAELGLGAVFEPFNIRMYDEEEAKLFAGGREIPCRAYFGIGNGSVKAKLYYLEGDDEVSLKKCRDKIVLSNNPLGRKLYLKLKDSGAVGVITYSGKFHGDDDYIARKTVRYTLSDNEKMPVVNIHIKDAYEIVKNGVRDAEITVRTKEYIGVSHNVILDFKGKTDETVVVSAHFDSTELSRGVYDNMSGCIALLYLAEYFAKKECERKIRLIWCGSEEMGLLGSRAYCKYHEKELKNTVLNINLDMLGCSLGGFVAFSCADEKMTDYLEKFVLKEDFPATVKHTIRSSDSNSFLQKGVPAVSFARYASGDTAPVHTKYDTPSAVSADVLLKDMEFIKKFTDMSVNAKDFPIDSNISQKIKTDIEEYFDGQSDVL